MLGELGPLSKLMVLRIACGSFLIGGQWFER